jgi:hypothetical protein
VYSYNIYMKASSHFCGTPIKTLSVHWLKASNNSGTAEHSFTIFYSEKRHENLSRCVSFHYNQTKITDSVQEDLLAFLRVSRAHVDKYSYL